MRNADLLCLFLGFLPPEPFPTPELPIEEPETPSENIKVLPVSGSNPQWLIDLTPQKQAELNSRLAASAAATAAIITVPQTNNEPNNETSANPEVPTTVVACAINEPTKAIASVANTTLHGKHQN